MAKELVWTNRYNCYTTRLFHDFYLNVNWEMKSKNTPPNPDGPYVVSACGMTCKKRVQTVEDGQKLAVRFARKLLTDALAALPEDSL